MQHPSTTSHSIKFRDELARLQQAHVKVQHGSGNGFSDTCSVDQLFNCATTSEENLNVLYPYYVAEKYDKYNIDLPTLLSSGDVEDACQAKIKELLVDGLKVAADTSTSSCGMFMPAREMCVTDESGVVEPALYTPTAKHDLTGIHSSQAVEVKTSPQAKTCATKYVSSDVELLKQVLERMSVEIYCNALLSNFTVLGATGRFAWVFVFERKLEFFNETRGGGYL